jgi:hypothetical protein
MMHIIQIRNRRSQALDPGRGTVFAPRRADVDLVRALKGADDVVVDFGGALAEVRPLVGLVGEAVLVGALGAPDDSCRGAGGVEAGVGFVAFVRVAELAVDLGVCFCGGGMSVYVWKTGMEAENGKVYGFLALDLRLLSSKREIVF